MCAEKIRDKIAKLLALAGSSNEHEAKAALLKARTLMAEHKLSRLDIQPAAAEDEVVNEATGITFTMRSTPWIRTLCTVIADQLCCKVLVHHFKGRKQYDIRLIGLRSDLDLCKTILLYALGCAKNGCSRAREEVKERGRSVKEQTNAAKAYGVGFSEGVAQMYAEQNAQHPDPSTWGLILQTPQPVLDYISRYKTKTYRTTLSADALAYREDGRIDGMSFSPQYALE